MKQRVCHISTVHPAFDVRIFHKQCKALAKSGYEVKLIVTHNKEEVVDGVHVIPLPSKSGRLYRIFIKTFLAFQKARKVKAHIYHFHDPELMIMGLMLKLFGKKVVYDVHEDVPVQILNKQWLGSMNSRKRISSLFNFIEKSISKSFDGISTVTTEIKEKFSSCKRVVILKNLPDLDIIDDSPSLKIPKNKFTVVYAGGLTDIRGIKELVNTVGILDGKAELWLLGAWDHKEFREECSHLKGWKYTKDIGFKPLSEVYSYMKIADIGMCTLHPTKNHLESLPVKAFEYMACELPMIMSEFPYWIKNYETCAVFVDPLKPESIASKINEFIDNPEYTKEFGNRNRKLVENQYSWDVESKKLIHLYEDILG